MKDGDITKLQRYNFLHKAIGVNLCLLSGFTIAALMFVFNVPVVVYFLAVLGWVFNIAYSVYYIKSKLCMTKELERRHNTLKLTLPIPHKHPSSVERKAQ